MGHPDNQEQRDAQEQDRVDAMQRSLTRLQGDIGAQRHALEGAQGDLARRQGDVAERQHDLDASERFEEDLRQNIDNARHKPERPHGGRDEPAAS